MCVGPYQPEQGTFSHILYQAFQILTIIAAISPLIYIKIKNKTFTIKNIALACITGAVLFLALNTIKNILFQTLCTSYIPYETVSFE